MNESKRPRGKYKTTNWRRYNQALKARGALMIWLDRDLQWYVQERMATTAAQFGATWTSAVVIRVSDGAIMALADYPTLDPNEFREADPSVTGSRAFAIPFEPGSIMKPINAATDSG